MTCCPANQAQNPRNLDDFGAMDSDRLPVCRHRGAEFAPGRWICASPRLVAAKGVTGHICRELLSLPEPRVSDRSACRAVSASQRAVWCGHWDL